jgi:hypothetical protein
MKNSGQSVIHWINPLSILSQFWSLMSQLMWMILKLTICDLQTIIVIAVFENMRKEIPYLMKKEKLAEYLFGGFIFLYFQLPLLIEFQTNIGMVFLFTLLLANSGTVYSLKQNSNRNISIGMVSLVLVYFYLLGLWFIPMICFKFACLFLIYYLDIDVFKTNYLPNI